MATSRNSAQLQAKNLPSSSATACHRCREQKLRCTRELPTCSRCFRQSNECCYPAPPDRKLLALDRWARKRQRNSLESTDRTGLSDYQIKPSSTSIAAGNGDNACNVQLSYGKSINSNNSPTLQEKEPSKELPPRPLGVKLLEIFTSRNLTISFAFHAGRLFNSYFADAVPPYMLQAIFALSSIFLQSPETRTDDAPDRKQSNIWAIDAGSHVLSHADQPSLGTVQTCAMLSLYWFAMGELERSKIHARLAYSSARILGFHSRYNTTTFGDEIRRRSFWVTWILTCLIPYDDSYMGSHIAHAVDVTLPSTDASFRQQCVVVHQKMNNSWMPVCISGAAVSSGSQGPGFIAEVVKAFGIYLQLQSLLVRFPETPMHTRLNEVFALHQKAMNLYQSLPPPPQHTKQGIQGYDTSATGLLFFIKSIYHKCAITMHKSLVPLFCGQSLDDKTAVHVQLINTCADIAVDHADKFTEMVEEVIITSGFDSSYIPPFAGYCAFTAASVYAILMYKADVLVQPSLSVVYSRLLSNMVLLNDLRAYWAVLHQMWNKLSASLPINISSQDLDRHRKKILAEGSDSFPSDSIPRSIVAHSGSDWLLEPLAECKSLYERLQYVLPDGLADVDDDVSRRDFQSVTVTAQEDMTPYSLHRDDLKLDDDRIYSDIVGSSLQQSGLENGVVSSFAFENEDLFQSFINADLDLQAIYGL